MFNAYSKIVEQYEKDDSLLLYIEEKGRIVATVGVKDMSEDKTTIDVLAVDKEYRGKGYASILLKEAGLCENILLLSNSRSGYSEVLGENVLYFNPTIH